MSEQSDRADADADQGRDVGMGAGEHVDQPDQQRGGRGAESYGGDSDSEPSVTEEEVERGLRRDQSEG